MGSNEEISVMIVGAGSGGRLIAQGLRKTGVHCTVFEQDDSLDSRTRDWDFGIYWAQTPLDQCLPKEVSDRVITAQVDNVGPSADAFIPIFKGDTGELMHKIPTPYYLRLKRKQFARVMGADIDIRYGKRLVNVDASSDSGVTATFADGTTHTATLLVGAEGAHSLVREYLLGPEKGAIKFATVPLSITLTKLPVEVVLRLRELSPRIWMVIHPNGTFLWIGIHDAYDKPNPEDWVFSIMASWKHDAPTLPFTSSADIIRDMKERAEAFGEPFRSVYRSIPDDQKAWSNFLPYWPTQPWEDHPARGRVTLAGDAAHPMTPHRGQGLNNAILDCQQLVNQIEAMPDRTAEALADAVKKYEEEVWERGNEAVTSSFENTMAIHNWSTLMQSPLITAGIKPKADKVIFDDEKPASEGTKS